MRRRVGLALLSLGLLVACGSRGDKVGCKDAWAIDLVDYARTPADDTDAHVLAKDLRDAGARFATVGRLGGAPAPIAEIGTLLVRRANLLDAAGTDGERRRIASEGGASVAKPGAAPSASAAAVTSATAPPSARPSASPPAGSDAALHLSDASYEALRANQASLDEAWRELESQCPR